MTKLGLEAFSLYCVYKGWKEGRESLGLFMQEHLLVQTVWLNVAKHVRKQQRKAVKDAISKTHNCRTD